MVISDFNIIIQLCDYPFYNWFEQFHVISHISPAKLQYKERIIFLLFSALFYNTYLNFYQNSGKGL